MTKQLPYSILVIDDEQEFFDTFFKTFESKFIRTKATSIAEGAEKLRKEGPFHAILLDLQFPNTFEDQGDQTESKGLRYLSELVENPDNPPVIIVTYDQNMGIYQAALNRGAAGFWPKSNINYYIWKLYIENTILQFDPANHLLQYERIINSNTYNKILIAFKSLKYYPRVPIILQGKTGVGKGFILKHLWPLVSEAKIERISLHQQKDTSLEVLLNRVVAGSTIFWPDLEHFSAKQQEELVQLLDTSQYLGFEKWIFTCTRSLDILLEEKKISEALYQRLVFFAIPIPSLKERIGQELESWLELFLRQPKVCPVGTPFYEKEASKVFDQEVIEKLKNYHWPANIRELRGVIQLAIGKAIEKGKYRIELDCLVDRIKDNRVIKPEVGNKQRHQEMVPLWSPKQNKIYEELKRIEKTIHESGGRLEEAIRFLDIKDEEEFNQQLREYSNLYPAFFRGTNFPILQSYGFQAVNGLLIAHPKNKEIHNELKDRLGQLKEKHTLEISSILEIQGGYREKNDQQKLNEANIILVLLCTDLLKGEKEILTQIKKNLRYNNKIVVPVICKTCYWQGVEWLSHQIRLRLPEGDLPINDFTNREEAYVQVLAVLDRLLDQFKK